MPGAPPNQIRNQQTYAKGNDSLRNSDAFELLVKKFPEMADYPPSDPAMAFVRVHPSVISILD
jgi:hypothetical protein